ncbi:hypothetical protein OG244_03735 [Streptomyces brevispora]|uniref:hypothetical protein n=1 Tax=Streptomyces brevispora TaxID=887462 RepID=UPI002E329F71|nr:hypothetical protein [Streptomyces brevispora]
MTDADLLLFLGLDPARLDPALPWTPCGGAAIERLRGRRPCVRCGWPSTVAGAVDIPGHGRRWVDRCMPCLTATTPRGEARAPLEHTLAAVTGAAREADAKITIVTDGT